MLQSDRVGLDWLTLFNLSEQENKQFIRDIKNHDMNYNFERLYYFINIKEIQPHDEFYKKACEIIVLELCLKLTNFAKNVLSEAEFDKCLKLYERKQYNSNLLKELLGKFCYVLNTFHNNMNYNLNDLLRLKIIQQVEFLKEQETDKSFTMLKKQIEIVASGVKGLCYLMAEKQFINNVLMCDIQIDSELNNFLKSKYKYNFNYINREIFKSLFFYDNRVEIINKIFQKALFNHSEFWKQHQNFNVFNFLQAILVNNDYRHAEKILDYIFSQISGFKYGKQLIENSLCLIYLDYDLFIERIEARTKKFAFERFENNFDLQKVNASNFCYPLTTNDNFDYQLSQGEKLIQSFFKEIYSDNFEEIWKILIDEISSPTAAFSSREQKLNDFRTQIRIGKSISPLTLAVQVNDEWTISNIFDSHTFGYHDYNVDKKAIEVYCPQYFSTKNIWNRLYIKAYCMYELVNKNKKLCFANLFEIYYDLFQFIEKKMGIKTSYQRNTEWRDETYLRLKAVLSNHDLKISDKYKSDYIISLLDRKVAIREESERFPILEQLGDAIYGFAVAELLFYNPDQEDIGHIYNDCISAKKQIKVANYVGIEKLYLSSYSLPRKYERDILIDPDEDFYSIIQEHEQLSNSQKFIADSLEMIIGTICKDCGYKKALDFTKEILKATFPETFKDEVHWDKNQNLNIDTDYWTRILPAPYSVFEDCHSVLWQAFDKFFKAYVLGTDDKEIRQFITYSYHNDDLYDDHKLSYQINKVFYEYLHNGLENAIEKYSKKVKENYNNKNK